MRPDQLLRIESLRDRLLEVALKDADPDNWIGTGKKPDEMTREERGDAKWCRSLAVQTVALTMQVQRLMLNPVTGNAAVANEPDKSADETDTVEAEIARYETAAAEVLTRAARRGKR